MHRMPERPRKYISELAWRRLRSPVERPELSEQSRRVLQEVLAPEVEDLRKLTGRRFATWSL